MDDFKDLLTAIAFVALIFGGIVWCVACLVAALDYADCRGFQSGTGIETKWRWGCYAKVDGQWVPKAYAFGDVNELRIKAK